MFALLQESAVLTILSPTDLSIVRIHIDVRLHCRFVCSPLDMSAQPREKYARLIVWSSRSQNMGRKLTTYIQPEWEDAC